MLAVAVLRRKKRPRLAGQAEPRTVRDTVPMGLARRKRDAIHISMNERIKRSPQKKAQSWRALIRIAIQTRCCICTPSSRVAAMRFLYRGDSSLIGSCSNHRQTPQAGDLHEISAK